jgi:2-succinyl-6-hydroxy-2,4-cyclohexadiene-1-carboxylate synthase
MHNIPLVFLHGFLGSAADWDGVISHIPHRTCLALNLPGTEKLLIPVPKFHLIGYSMGGRIALSYAKEYPHKIASLTLLSAHPGLQTEKERKERWESDQRWAKLLLELPIDEFLKQWYDQSIFKPFRPDLTNRRKQNVQALAASLLHYSLAKQPRYEVTECLVGERDEKFKALFPDPILIKGAGHMVHLENPKQVAAEIMKRVER